MTFPNFLKYDKSRKASLWRQIPQNNERVRQGFTATDMSIVYDMIWVREFANFGKATNTYTSYYYLYIYICNYKIKQKVEEFWNKHKGKSV